MTDSRIAPYGTWTSPISAESLASSGHPVGGGAYAGDEVWWQELRPTEGGRLSIRRAGADGEPVDVLPAPWNARTRVHEYGGGAWTVAGLADGPPVLVFANFDDQRVYRLDVDTVDAVPSPLTPGGLAVRFAELQQHGAEIIAVRETHTGSELTRDIVAIPLDGSAASDAGRIRSIVSGSHFLASPRISPDGTKIAWIAWEHPQMPWDGTELRVGALDEAGQVREWRTLAGSTTESVLQPEWRGDDALFVISDRTGWWNLYLAEFNSAFASSGTEPVELRPLHAASFDFGGALWMLGTTWYTVLDADRLLTVRTFGTDQAAILDVQTGELTELPLEIDSVSFGARRGDRILVTGGSAVLASGLRELDLQTRALTDIRLSVDDLPDRQYLPTAVARTFGTDERPVHTFVYEPANPDFTAPDGERPPFVAFVHGGPTSRTVPALDPAIAYFTSRGIGVVDINYGGSTGYGREYRDRLRGQWGVVDVDDTVAAVRGLAEAGIADGDRLAIRGGSAGGWTVLASLTQSDVFACGASYFGVAELTLFAAETHDFESHYLDGLVGPLPEAAALYEQRAPLNNVDGLSCPVLLLQGLDDKVVPPSQAERFRDALEAKGLRYAYLAYEGESHGFRRASTIISATEAELSFYGQVMGFVPVDVPVLEMKG
ncbi:Dipeptidyl aminopeptidase/acylaminoacyl peptidase [Agreia bicolorata]|uniref:Dipeptidyl aminopeptidase/acylaminoacyl peptidase n=1 Tax=Agreia bicolorata TaxID=110935 RepID=A0A1T4WZH6_9MICO|nr:prolyl oligopeptidase family serine peptidase [Agreia bicolorata]SKA82740.1 Dipeptidyl aminopeptidase/acylaminoacyl peptidase [Agreia bicolorata]